ncbi:MAG: hypothetical protein U9N01_04495 [Euryarchaeota archaeon]|nr:hypothetical protein [Euryarchaeota archaeon]
MKPVDVNVLDKIGMAAEGQIAFGAAVYRSAANMVKGCLNAAAGTDFLGIATDDLIEKTVDGFYAKYDDVPIISTGRCRVWVTPDDDNNSIEAGDYLELAVLGTNNTLPVGVFMEAVAGNPAGEVRTTRTLARAMEDVTLTTALKYVKTESGEDVALGDTEITLTTTKTALFTAGDYILLEDLDGNVMINRVKSISGADLTLEAASTVALTGDTDYLHILTQVEAILI